MTQKKGPAPTNGKPSALNSAIVAEQHDAGKLALVIRKDGARIDSRVLAQQLRKKRHQDLFELVKRYEVKLLALGKVLFQTGASAGSSPNEKFVHLNVNRLINQTAGIEAGQRAGASFPTQSLLVVAQTVAAQAMQQAPDHRAGFQQTKAALLALTQATMIGRTAA